MFMFILGFITGVIVTLLVVFLLGPRIISWFFKKSMRKGIDNMQKELFMGKEEGDERWEDEDIL